MQASSYNAGVTAPATLTPEALQNRANALGLSFPNDLPVSARWQEIAQALLAHQVLILCGETGSGKTTQLPKIALACGYGSKGKSIGHTQPRRLAAVSVARRIAQEIKSECGRMPGARVGYKIRFNDQSRPGVPIKLLTDGMLLAETQADPRLEAYDLIIIDEAHERSLNIDFLLGYMHNLLTQRPKLKLIITSATLDAEKFSKHFFNAPILEVSGRLYPVEMRYQPPERDDDDLIDRVVTGIAAALAEPMGTGPADVLVFLPGEREIRATSEALADRLRPVAGHGRRQSVEVLPLFSRLTQADQDRIFRPAEGRRVVLSTNLAETSITVPGIRYVVDAGLARVKRYRYKGKVEQLQIEPVSQAQAQQRAGRAGRLSEGVCIRLYSEEDFLSRPVHADPEIHRSSLASVILQMKALHLPAIEVFPFVDPPSKKAIADGMALLNELGALDSTGALTEIGRDIAALPLDPKLARMLVAARQRGCLKEMAVLVAALSVQDPRDRPLAEQQAADTAHKKFADEKSEFISWLRLWDWIEAAFAEKLSRRKLDQALRAQFLSPLRVREWRELHQQVVSWITEKNWRCNERPADYASL
ncbi:MAG: ATP-dependent RNA helicase HrpA, partial [Burkholderiaceae bacterium]